jgi:hypothetical protein
MSQGFEHPAPATETSHTASHAGGGGDGAFASVDGEAHDGAPPEVPPHGGGPYTVPHEHLRGLALSAGLDMPETDAGDGAAPSDHATLADLLTVTPPTIRFGRMPYHVGRAPAEADPIEVTAFNPTARAIAVDDIRPEGGEGFVIYSDGSTDTTIPPGGQLRFRVGFRSHRPGTQVATIELVAGGASVGRVRASAHADRPSGHWEDLHVVDSFVQFSPTAVHQESAPRKIHVANRSAAPVQIDDVEATGGDGAQFPVYQTNPGLIPAGGSTAIELAFKPATAGDHQATFQLRTPGGRHGKQAAHTRIEAHGTGRAPTQEEQVASAAENRTAVVRAGGVVGPTITYGDMLASLRSAEQFTDSGAAQDASHGRADYDHARQLVAPVVSRLDGLEARVPEVAQQYGFATTDFLETFEHARTAVTTWHGLLAGKSTINPAPFVASFEVARDLIKVLTGEQQEVGALQTMNHAARWTPVEIGGAAAGASLLMVGGAGLGAFAIDAAPLVSELGASAWSTIVQEGATLLTAGNMGYAAAASWVLANPIEANEIVQFAGSIGLSIIDAGGLSNFIRSLGTRDGAINAVGQILSLFVGVRGARASYPGASETAPEAGPRAAGRAPDAGEVAPEPASAGERPPAGNAPTPSTPEATRVKEKVLGRVRALVARIKDLDGDRGIGPSREPDEEGGAKGARGPASGRDFDPSQAGGKVRNLSTEGVRVTPKGIDVVEGHLARFGPDEANQLMVERLRRIAAGQLEATPQDLNFYTHELRESVRYRRLGHATGDPGYDVWNNAHSATLEDYGLSELSEPHPLYHPSTRGKR